ncbi:hypothetical protein ACF3NA_10955 [Alkanindiges sp. WGS2144]|uniref:hypothetical protein n=1 Tax=Alkanindiges sp. WGS2144 TaxID=3366808 RepID=UPI00375316F8
MPQLAEHMVNFAQSGNQQRISLKSGQILQGWIMEITEDALLMSTGFSEKTGQDHWVDFEQLDLARLEYWDTKTQCWMSWSCPK